MVAAGTKYISTIAGTGTAGYSGDGGAATSAQISSPTAVAADATGNIFFIDKGNARVRRIDATTKYISTILSNSHVLTGIATDGSGNIYVSDSTAFSVLKITPGTFAVTTIAGTGASGYSGDGGAATGAQLNYPGGLAVDGSGNVYVADVANGVVRKFKPASTPAISGNTISTADSTVTCTGKISLTTLSGTVPTGGTGSYAYQWKQSADSVTFTAISGATGQNYAVNATITKTTWYRRFVTSGTLVDSGNAAGFHPRTTPVPVISLGKGTAAICQGARDTLTATAGYIKYAWSTGAATASIIDSVSGSFSVTVTDSFGCKGTSAAQVITVNAAPATPAVTSSPATTTNLCPGTVVTLTSSAGTTYKWSTGATTAAISVTAAGSYVDTVYNASGCRAYSAAKVVSYTTAPATPTVTSSPATTTNLCPGTVVTLTSSTGTTYKWSTGATTASISVTAAGSYTDTVYNASGCKAYSAATVVSYTTCAAPASPATSAYTGTTATLKWRQVSCAKQYSLQYALSSSTSWTTITVSSSAGSADTVYTLTGLSKSTAYKWQVAAVCTTSPAVTTSAYSSAVTFTTTSAANIANIGAAIQGAASPAEKDAPGYYDASVYPNPAVNTANLVLAGFSGKVVITVTDLSGKPVWKSESTPVNKIEIPVNNLAAGMYFITVKDEKHNKVIKLLKQ
jgi:hypothetical protein